MRSAPQRFIETWVDAVLGFLFCVVLPIPLYANDEPFNGPFDASELTIIVTVAAYAIVWYCGRLLDAFPGGVPVLRVTLDEAVARIAGHSPTKEVPGPALPGLAESERR